MSIQTEAMRKLAGDDRYITAFEDADGWHGIEYVNHPTPSGCRRDLPTYSDKRSWPSAEEAKAALAEVLGYPKTAQAAEDKK